MKWFLVVGLIAFGPRAGGAQESKALRKIEELNRAAMEDYDLLEFETAKKTLNDAITLVKKAKLEKHRIAARTYMNLAIVQGSSGDKDAATLSMVAALTIDSTMKIDKVYKSAELQKRYEEAKEAVKQAGGDSGGGEEPSGESSQGDGGPVSGLEHSPVDEATQGRAVTLTAKVGDDLNAKQVVLYFRGPGAAAFTPVAMKSKNGITYKGDIPASATKGDSVQYYIEAKTSAGKVASNAGNSGSPNIITLVPGSDEEEGGDVGTDDERVPGIEDGGDDDTSISKGAGVGKHSFFLGVSAGTGGAFVTGITEKEGQAISCCVAFELLNIKPEIGFWVTPQVTVSVVARIGLPLDANVVGAATVAPAALLKISYSFDASADGGVTLHGDVGGGLTRQTITLTDPEDPAHNKDTHASGPVLLGGGLGWVKPLGGPARFFIDATALAGLPLVKELGTAKPQFGFGLDLNLGLAMAF